MQPPATIPPFSETPSQLVARLEKTFYGSEPPLPKFTPTGDHLLVEPVEFKHGSTGKIALPESALEKPTTGFVRAIGPKVGPDGPQLGQRVLFGKYRGQEVQLGAKTFRVLKREEIEAVYD